MGSRDCPNPCVQHTCLDLAPRDARDEGDRDRTHALCDSSHHVCRRGASRAEETATFPQLGLGRSLGATGLSWEVTASCGLCKAGALGEEDDQGSLTAAWPRCLHHPGAHQGVHTSSCHLGLTSQSSRPAPCPRLTAPAAAPDRSCLRSRATDWGSAAATAKTGSLSADLPSWFSLAANSLQLLEEGEKIYRQFKNK